MEGAVLSLFPGIDLLGRGFEAAGYTVVRGPDLLWGQDVTGWRCPPGLCEGAIAGTPCQDYSRARRGPESGAGAHALRELVRILEAGSSRWWLLENVPGVPSIAPAGYTVQRFNVNAREVGCAQNRLRTFQFGSLDGVGLVIPRANIGRGTSQRCCMATEGNTSGRRTWREFCAAQGLPEDFDLPGWSLRAKYRAVGNGVPIELARVIAIAIRRRLVTANVRVCVCGCGRPVRGAALHGGPGCRKRMERRRRDAAAVTRPGPVTINVSPPALSSPGHSRPRPR